MSESAAHQVINGEEPPPSGQTASPRRVSFALSPRRTSSGSLVRIEGQIWPNHPKNKTVGSVNSNSNSDTNGTNQPSASNDVTGAEVQEKAVEDVDINDSEEQAVRDTAVSATIPFERGPGGIPRDGHAWSRFPANHKYVRLHGKGDGIDHASANLVNTTEAFLLADGEKKIEEKIDTRTPNTTIFTFNKEDHTLANLLRDKLLKNSHVTFSAYRIPHPLFAKFELRVQTDGEITPKEAVLATSRDLVQDLNNLKTNFTREYELRKMVGGAQNGQ